MSLEFDGDLFLALVDGFGNRIHRVIELARAVILQTLGSNPGAINQYIEDAVAAVAAPIGYG
jgi:hypothetical protein